MIRRALLGLCLCAGTAVLKGCADDTFVRGAPSDWPEASVVDAGGDVAMATEDANDAGDASSPACVKDAPFGPAELVPGINTPEEERNAWLSSDELTLFLIRGAFDAGAGSLDVLLGTRANRLDPFASLLPLVEVNSLFEEDNAMTSASGSLLVLHSARPPASATNRDLFVSKRLGNAYSMPDPITSVNGPSDDTNPFLSSDGSELFFDSVRGVGGDYDIYESKVEAGIFAAPSAHTELNSPSTDAQPVLSSDALTIFFASSRATTGAPGGLDIYTARRTSVSVPFGAPSVVPAVNSATDDLPTWVSKDGCTLYLASLRAGGVGGRDIWRAHRATQ